MLIITDPPDLDSVGRVVDFGVIKEKVGGWVEVNWDHGFIFYREDPLLAPLYGGDWRQMKHFAADWNPTAENMATHLLDVPTQLLAEGPDRDEGGNLGDRELLCLCHTPTGVSPSDHKHPGVSQHEACPANPVIAAVCTARVYSQ